MSKKAKIIILGIIIIVVILLSNFIKICSTTENDVQTIEESDIKEYNEDLDGDEVEENIKIEETIKKYDPYPSAVDDEYCKSKYKIYINNNLLFESELEIKKIAGVYFNKTQENYKIIRIKEDSGYYMPTSNEGFYTVTEFIYKNGELKQNSYYNEFSKILESVENEDQSKFLILGEVNNKLIIVENLQEIEEMVIYFYDENYYEKLYCGGTLKKIDDISTISKETLVNLVKKENWSKLGIEDIKIILNANSRVYEVLIKFNINNEYYKSN